MVAQISPKGIKDRWDWYSYEPEVGHVIERWHPYTLYIDRFPVAYNDHFQPVTWSESKRWRPGSWDARANHHYGEYLAYHEEGRVKIEVHAIAKPSGFPRRVMYTQQFVPPTGKPFKRSGLICHSIGKFRKVCFGPAVSGSKVDDFEPIVHEVAA